MNLSEAELRLLARAFPNSEEVFVERDLTAGLIGAPLPETPVPPRPKSAPARHWPVVAGLMSLLLVIAIAALGWLLFLRMDLPVRNPQAAQDMEPLAIIAGVAGRAEVRRQADERVQRATFGQDLFWEDAVLTYEGAAANILCENGLLFNLGARQVLVVRCQETEDTQLLGRLDPQLSAGLVQASGEITITLLTRLELVGAEAPADESFFFLLDEAGRSEMARSRNLSGPHLWTRRPRTSCWRGSTRRGSCGRQLSVNWSP